MYRLAAIYILLAHILRVWLLVLYNPKLTLLLDWLNYMELMKMNTILKYLIQ